MTINQIVYNYLKTPIEALTGMNGFFYMENNNEVKAPYTTIFMVDDPRDNLSLCASEEGQTRFQIDVFDIYHDTGINYRSDIELIAQGLQSQTINGYTLYNAQVLNINDRANTENNLFQFSFELIVSWEK